MYKRQPIHIVIKVLAAADFVPVADFILDPVFLLLRLLPVTLLRLLVVAMRLLRIDGEVRPAVH